MKKSRKEPVVQEEDSQSEMDMEPSEDEEIPSETAESARESDDENDVQEDEPTKSLPKTGKKKRGIIYISTIPKHMTVSIARDMFSQYAEVGRMFFQPETKPTQGDVSTKKKKNRFQVRHFSEGWIEFESKRAAKAVAARLNGQPIATRKSSKFADMLWTMKYLPRFKWVHLSERLTYEKAVFKQKMQAEVSQARKEAAFFQENLDRSDKNKRLKKQKAKLNKS